MHLLRDKIACIENSQKSNNFLDCDVINETCERIS